MPHIQLGKKGVRILLEFIILVRTRNMVRTRIEVRIMIASRLKHEHNVVGLGAPAQGGPSLYHPETL